MVSPLSIRYSSEPILLKVYGDDRAPTYDEISQLMKYPVINI